MMSPFIKTAFIAFIWLILGSTFHVAAQGMFLNEASNGPSGNKEYYEYVVIGTPCSTVDLRGWIIDDNNGDFACGPITGVGIAAGHVRLANVAAWSAIPVGSILLFYNDVDLNVLVPASDPTDADMDSVYVVPYSSTLLERTSGSTACPLDAADQLPIGCSASCPATGSSAYSPATYTAGGGLAQISLANAGDAAQVRTPAGAYFHGISWGVAGVTGGPDGLKISTLSGTGKNYFLSGMSYSSLANWAEGIDDGVAGGSESPGAPNNAQNAALIDSLLGNCLLPVEYEVPLSAVRRKEDVELEWSTRKEEGNHSFTVLRQHEGASEWIAIGSVSAKPTPGNYSFLDEHPDRGATFYRLRQEDMQGTSSFSNVVHVGGTNALGEVDHQLFPNPSEGMVTIRYTSEENLQLEIFDLMGKQVRTGFLSPCSFFDELTVDLTAQPAGLYLYSLRGATTAASGVIVLK